MAYGKPLSNYVTITETSIARLGFFRGIGLSRWGNYGGKVLAYLKELSFQLYASFLWTNNYASIDFQNVIEQRLIYLNRTVSITTLYTNVVTL